LNGDIRPEQFMTGAGEEGGFFDALANGPVSVSSVDGSSEASSLQEDR
jgi:conjugal transfer pilus assembly protein TraF